MTEIVRLYVEERLSVPAVARRVGRTEYHVEAHLRVRVVEMRPGGGPFAATLAEERAAVSAYSAGLGIAGVAERFGRSQCWVSRVLERWGVPRNPPGRRRTVDRERVVALRREGRTRREIISIVGASHQAVSDALAEAGLIQRGETWRRRGPGSNPAARGREVSA